MSSPQKPRAIIIGGGFSGLTLAYELEKHNFSVCVFEKERWGGLISTEHRSEMQIESAANGFLNSASVEDICSDIGCELQTVQTTGKKRFIFRQGLRQWPLSKGATLRLICKVLPLLIFQRQKLKPNPGESIQDWGLRVLNQEALDYLLSPVLQGIYAGSVAELSASLILKKMFEPGRSSTRKLKARGTVAPPLGMGEFIDKLKTYLLKKNVELQLLNKAERIKIEAHDIVIFATQPWELLNSVDALEFSTGFPESEIQKFKRAIHAFNEIQVLPLLRVTMAFQEPKYKVPGFGVLFAKKDGFHTLGVLANSQIFAGRGDSYNESWIIEGRQIQLSDQEILSYISDDRARAFGAQDPIQSAKIIRWPKALSLYSTEHEKKISQYEKAIQSSPPSQIFLTGNYLGNLGLAKILEQNKSLAQKIEQGCKKGNL